jgi:hypothetical protein
MTPEELELALKEVSERLDELSKLETKLTKVEWQLQHRLIEEQDILQQLKKAHESNNLTKEGNLLAQYNLIKDAESRHPIINYLIKLRLRSFIWG